MRAKLQDAEFTCRFSFIIDRVTSAKTGFFSPLRKFSLGFSGFLL